jgi:hypothetical protein
MDPNLVIDKDIEVLSVMVHLCAPDHVGSRSPCTQEALSNSAFAKPIIDKKCAKNFVPLGTLVNGSSYLARPVESSHDW